jgi:hypothetical protein
LRGGINGVRNGICETAVQEIMIGRPEGAYQHGEKYQARLDRLRSMSPRLWTIILPESEKI